MHPSIRSFFGITGVHMVQFLAATNFRFRCNSDEMPGVERIAIMLPDPQMLDGPYTPCQCLHSQGPNF